MRTRVTTVLVARDGGDWLKQTLDGLATQTRQPDRLIAVVNSGKEKVAKQVETQASPLRIVTTQSAMHFGAAVNQGVVAIPAGTRLDAVEPQQDSEPIEDWFWLLTEDSAPEPRALEELIATVRRAPSVVVAGPKLVNWDQPDRIIELGQSLTHRGDRWLLRRQERDQQQYDHLQDVLGVGPVGMFVRADVWQQLAGFDPAYPVYDDGLDFCVRARLAGHRVIVAPTSRIRFAQRGIAGPRIERSGRVLRAAHREARTSDLHRRISYAAGFNAFFMWLGLPFVAIARMIWSLIRERPGNLWGELSSALAVFFRPASLRESRRRVSTANVAGWGAVDPLRTDPKSVRTARMIDREAILAAQGRVRDELHFISTGGLAVLIVASLSTLGLTWWAVTQTSLTGGGLAPLSPLGELWANTRTVGGVPADPFTWVLAVLGSLTFYNPSQAVVLMLVASIPLAALGGWIWAAGLTKATSGRVLLGLGWAFSPVLLGSISAGRLGALILAVILPWLLLAASRARTSWSWVGITSLLAAVALACAPVLLPAATVLLIVGVIGPARGFAKVLSTAVAPLVLFAPKILALLGGASPLDLLRDPGITSVFTPGSTWHLLVGFPEFGLEGWGHIFSGLGLGGAPASLLVGVLLLPIVLLAALGLITGSVRFTLLNALLGALGLLTAVGASQLQLAAVGDQGVALWTGSGLALYWIAVLGLAAVGVSVLGKVAAPVVTVALVAALVAVGPLTVKLATANTELAPGVSQMPALVQAAGGQDPTLHTLMLAAIDDHSVRAQVVTGPLMRLDQVRIGAIPAHATEDDQWVAQLVGVLASTGGNARVLDSLREHGVGFVMLDAEGDPLGRSMLQSSLDQQTALENAGQTDHGLLWRVRDTAPGGGTDQGDDGTGLLTQLGNLSNAAFAHALWVLQIAVLLGVVLLALPTGEVFERPERRRKNAVAVGVEAADAEAADAETAGAEVIAGQGEDQPAAEQPAPVEAAHEPSADAGPVSSDSPDLPAEADAAPPSEREEGDQ